MTVTFSRSLVLIALLTLLPSPAAAQDDRFAAVPFQFDPGKTSLVQSGWLTGLGCPTEAPIFTGPPAPGGFTDLACPTGDPRDGRQEGLLLVKTGPTGNIASSGVDLKGVQGTVLTELGYDIRKPGAAADPRGSHCGAGAPRFNIVIAGETYFLGCNSPAAPDVTAGDGWLRLRWAAPLQAFGPTGLTNITGLVAERISIVFDEGQDTGPDNVGLAILDNIDVNGTLVGRGPAGGR